jgi:hypothetical protein
LENLMTVVIPQTAFDPAATVWARWVEEAIKSLQADSVLKTQNDANVNQGQGATLTTLGQTIRDIQSTNASLAATIANQKSLALPTSFSTLGMALPAGGTSYTASLTVPANMTQCAYVMLVYGSGINSTAGNSFLGVTIQAPGSGAATAPAAAGVSAYASRGANGLLTGLTPGQTLNFQAMIYSTGSWAANAANALHIQVMGTFMP